MAQSAPHQPVSPTAHRPLMVAALITLALLAARLFAAPALTDPTGAALPTGLGLKAPPLYLALAPLFSLWDGVGMLSLSRLRGFLAGLGLLYLLWRVLAWRHIRTHRSLPRAVGREVVVLLLSLAGFVAFLAGGLLWHRPMLSLRGVPPNLLVFDIHSHSNVSHDVRGTLMDGYDAEANRRWHARGGFDAFFLTDHNTVANLPPIHNRRARHPALCPGIEVSAWRAHIVLLGARQNVPRDDYADSLAGVLDLIHDAGPRYGALAIASIPEYVENHWQNLPAFISAGLAGFEVVNAAPKANELTQVRRDSVIALARTHDRLMLGATDSHGWGATSMVWNLIALPGWREQGSPCPRLLAALQSGGFSTVQVVERHRLRPEAWWPSWLTPVGVVWETWRGLTGPLTVAWLGWIWAVAGLLYLRRRAP